MRRSLLALAQVFGYVAAVLVATVAVMGVTKSLGGDWEAHGIRLSLLGDGLLTMAGIALTGLAIARIGRSTLVWDGWPGLRQGMRGFGFGALGGLGMAAGMLILTIALGGATIETDRAALPRYLPYVIPLLGCILASAGAEEWFFRGYPLTKLSRVFGRKWANLGMALLFAAAHLGSEGWNELVTLNIILGSLVVGAYRFTPGGIPAAWGFHFAWNSLQAMAGVTLTGESLGVPFVSLAARGAGWESGGTLGPEASLGATVATVVALAVLIRYFRRRPEIESPLPRSYGTAGPR